MSDTDSKRSERINESLKQLASKFIQEESSHISLITVTGINLSKDLKKASILITVYPEEKQNQALDFLHRKRSDFKKFVKSNSRLGRIPFFDFEIDMGEKNRQRVEELSQGI